MAYLFRQRNLQASNGRRYRYLARPRVTAFDHLHPQRWNWAGLVTPLDRSLERGAQEPLTRDTRLGLRYFWLHGLCNATSDAFYLSFIPLFAVAYGATTGQIGWLTAVANMLGAISLFPGARAVEKIGKRKPIVNWTFGGIGRFTLLVLAGLPLLGLNPLWAIVAIISLNSLRSFMDNFSHPAWTSLVADIVPGPMRGQYFGNRNIAMGVAALFVVPLAGWLIRTGNNWDSAGLMGYQIAFFLAFGVGLFSTWNFSRIPEPEMAVQTAHQQHQGGFRHALKNSPGFWGLVISAFIWNMALQLAAPFFNVYLVNQLHVSIAMVGVLAGITSLSALIGQQIFRQVIDRRGSIWVQRLAGLLIPVLPIAWIFATSPVHIALINAVSGVFWAGYNLANFNLVLELTPDIQRPRAVALYQTAVFTSAVVGPLLGGYLADAVSFQFIFGLSGAGRLLAMFVFLWLVVQPALRNGKGAPVMQTSRAYNS